MTEAERTRLTIAYCRDHEARWTAYLAKPLAEREAIVAKVEATSRQHGIQAGRDMMRTPGMPMVPDELGDPAEVLEAKQLAGDADEDAWKREAAALLGLSDAEIEDVLGPDQVGRVDH